LPWNGRKIEHANVQLADELVAIANSRALGAELFMLAHELGHIVTQRELRPRVLGNDEADADAYGIFFDVARGPAGGVQGRLCGYREMPNR